MKKLEQYLEQFSNKSITLIGPLFDGKVQLAEPILYIDGGARYQKEKGFSLGDNDSFSGVLDLVIPKEKDFSDLAFALNRCNGYTEVFLHGFLGERKDHELCNFGEVFSFLKNQKDSTVFLGNSIIAHSSGSWSVALNGTFSILSLSEMKLSILGACQYEITDKMISPLSSHTLSNIGTGVVKIESNTPFFIISN